MSLTVPTSIRAIEMIAQWSADRRLDLRSDPITGAGAVFSRCGRYRYLLWRRPVRGVPFMGLGMLNPSTADHERNDPTVNRGMALAIRARLSGPLVWNLFALRATRPAILKADRLPVGLYNDAAIDLALLLADHTIAAWGAHGAYRDRDRAVLQRCVAASADMRALKFTKHGHPAHPLYLPAALQPQPWEIF